MFRRKKPIDVYDDPLSRFVEPIAMQVVAASRYVNNPVVDTCSMLSIAISLKRIADKLEYGNGEPGPTPTTEPSGPGTTTTP
jgi:hypothetical protein